MDESNNWGDIFMTHNIEMANGIVTCACFFKQTKDQRKTSKEKTDTQCKI